MITREQCRGCNDDFYNGRTNIGGDDRCWSAKGGRMAKRYAIGTWTAPTVPFAFTEVRVPSCYRQKGTHYTDKLPDFVKLSEVASRPTGKKDRR